MYLLMTVYYLSFYIRSIKVIVAVDRTLRKKYMRWVVC
jgi:hypothetical protein